MKKIFNYLFLLLISTCFMLEGCTEQYGAYEQTTRKNKLIDDEVQRHLDMYRNGLIFQIDSNFPKTKPENKSTTPMVEIQSDWMADFLQTLLDQNEIQIETINDLDIPIESRFEIKGSYGCISAYPYNIIIHQEGQFVTITSITNYKDKKEYRSNLDKFTVFWLIFSSIDINSLKEFYGGEEISKISTADFRGNLSINVTTRYGKLSKDIRIRAGAGTIECEEIAKLIKAMTWLVHGDNLVFYHFKQLWD